MALTPQRFRALKREAIDSIDYHPEQTTKRLVQLHPSGQIAKVWVPLDVDDIDAGTTVHVQEAPLLWAITGDSEVEQVDFDDMKTRGDFLAYVPNAKGLREHWIVLTKAEAIRTAKQWRLDE